MGIPVLIGTQEIAQERYADNPSYCPHCQSFTYHWVLFVRLYTHLDMHFAQTEDQWEQHRTHRWFLKCVNPHCGKVYTKYLHTVSEKLGAYCSRFFPIANGHEYMEVKMQPLQPPKDYDELYSDPKLVPGIEATTGYLDPDGIYYPCWVELDYGQQVAVSYNHDGYARNILYHILKMRHQEIDAMGASEVQHYIVSQGWVKLDKDGIYPKDVSKYTDKQVATLTKIIDVRAQETDSINRAAIGKTFADAARKLLKLPPFSNVK